MQKIARIKISNIGRGYWEGKRGALVFRIEPDGHNTATKMHVYRAIVRRGSRGPVISQERGFPTARAARQWLEQRADTVTP